MKQLRRRLSDHLGWLCTQTTQRWKSSFILIFWSWWICHYYNAMIVHSDNTEVTILIILWSWWLCHYSIAMIVHSDNTEVTILSDNDNYVLISSSHIPRFNLRRGWLGSSWTTRKKPVETFFLWSNCLSLKPFIHWLTCWKFWISASPRPASWFDLLVLASDVANKSKCIQLHLIQHLMLC